MKWHFIFSHKSNFLKKCSLKVLLCLHEGLEDSIAWPEGRTETVQSSPRSYDQERLPVMSLTLLVRGPRSMNWGGGGGVIYHE